MTNCHGSVSVLTTACGYACGYKDYEPNIYEVQSWKSFESENLNWGIFEVQKTLLPVSGGSHKYPKSEKHGDDVCSLAVGVSSLGIDKRPDLSSLLKVDHFLR